MSEGYLHFDTFRNLDRKWLFHESNPLTSHQLDKFGHYRSASKRPYRTSAEKVFQYDSRNTILMRNSNSRPTQKNAIPPRAAALFRERGQFAGNNRVGKFTNGYAWISPTTNQPGPHLSANSSRLGCYLLIFVYKILTVRQIASV